MPLLRIPKSIFWILLNSILFLAIMMAYRIIVQSLIGQNIGEVDMAKILWMGFRFDARYVALVGMLAVLIGFFPGLHLFRSHAGKHFGIILYTVFAALLLFIYGLDFATQISFNTRIDAAMLSELISQTGRATKLMATAPWVIILLLTGVGSWLLYMAIRFLHHVVGKNKSTDNKSMRIFWQAVVLLGFAMAIYGRFGQEVLSYKIALALGNEGAAKVAINALEAIVHSL